MHRKKGAHFLISVANNVAKIHHSVYFCTKKLPYELFSEQSFG